MIESINNIHPGDGTKQISWFRVCKMIPTLKAQGAVDLSEYKIKICQNSLGLVVVDGNHTLARILQLVGDELIIKFNLDRENEDIAGNLIHLTNSCGITNFHIFLEMCKTGQFTRPNNEIL